MINKYRIRCNTDSKNEYVLSDAIPTVCPANSGHTINSSSVCIIETDVQIDDGTNKSLTLSGYKQLKINKINYQSGVLLSSGATHNGKQYSVSSIAVGKIDGLNSMIDKGHISFPVKIAAMDESQTIINNQADWDAFTSDFGNRINDVLSAGTDLKQSILDATDEAGVDAVTDSRT